LFLFRKISNKVLYNLIHHFDRGRTSRPIPSILRPPGRDRDSYYDDQDFDELSPTTTLTPSDAAKPLSLLPQVQPKRVQPPPPPPPPPPVPLNPDCNMKELNKMFGMTASDIDKYSRIVFPITFLCFHLTYWMVYQRLASDMFDDADEEPLVLLNPED